MVDRDLEERLRTEKRQERDWTGPVPTGTPDQKPPSPRALRAGSRVQPRLQWGIRALWTAGKVLGTGAAQLNKEAPKTQEGTG